MRDQQQRTAHQVEDMRRAWDLRATLDPILFTDPGMVRRAPGEYFEQAGQQARALTSPTFRELGFDPGGRRMLEIGCGIGRLFPAFAGMFGEVWGVDVSAEMLEHARRLHALPNARFIQNSGYDLAGLPDGRFDFVFSYNTLQHVPERWMVLSYLAETHRVLKPGGVCQLHFKTDHLTLRSRIYRRLPDPLQRPAQALLRLLLLYPLRGLPLESFRPPGGTASWSGASFSPREVEAELSRLGFEGVRSLPGETLPIATKFWAIGRKPQG